ncbi:hypothetical protein AXA44_38965 [Rhodococcus sp. SC4]|nr:hypothetical protein AXA44_38965 [Rhodococcus sp. SC4]
MDYLSEGLGVRAPIGERDFGAGAGAFDDGQLGQDHRMPKFLGSVGGDEKVHVGADVVGFGADGGGHGLPFRVAWGGQRGRRTLCRTMRFQNPPRHHDRLETLRLARRPRPSALCARFVGIVTASRGMITS